MAEGQWSGSRSKVEVKGQGPISGAQQSILGARLCRVQQKAITVITSSKGAKDKMSTHIYLHLLCYLDVHWNKASAKHGLLIFTEFLCFFLCFFLSVPQHISHLVIWGLNR